MILWGLARHLAKLRSRASLRGAPGAALFSEISAVTSVVWLTLKKLSTPPKSAAPWVNPSVLFVDEIHRFNKASARRLPSPHGKRRHHAYRCHSPKNPSFECQMARLLSRSRVVVLENAYAGPTGGHLRPRA